MDPTFYQIYVVWVVILLCSSFMSVCCCFCTFTKQLVTIVDAIGIAPLANYMHDYEFN